MEKTKESTAEDNQVSLLEEKSLKEMTAWYNQQIALARKSKELAEIKASIANYRLEETRAMIKIAELTVGPNFNQDDLTSESQTGPNSPSKTPECDRSGSTTLRVE